jgi:hypothetical protein
MIIKYTYIVKILIYTILICLVAKLLITWLLKSKEYFQQEGITEQTFGNIYNDNVYLNPPSVETQTFNMLPPGCIVMWNGTTNNIPDGWAVCDGQNGTPNLTDRYIKAGTQVTTGNAAVSISGTTSSTGSHTHGINSSTKNFRTTKGSSWCSGWKTGSGVYSLSQSASGTHSHPYTVTTATDIKPKWQKLIFIMRIR